MGQVSLTTLRSLARERADMVGSAFIADSATGIDRWINEAAQALHQMLVQKFDGDFYEKTATVTVTAGVGNLPSDFLKLLGAEIASGSSRLTLKRYNRQERNAFRDAPFADNTRPRYKLSGVNATGGYQTIRLQPEVTTTLYIFYSPGFTAVDGSGNALTTGLVAGTDCVLFPNGWEKYVVLSTAIQMLKKEESSTTDLEKELAACVAEIDSAAEKRDEDQAPQAVDADVVDFDPTRFY